MRTLRTALTELLGLVVEDGYVALGALLALGTAYGLTRDAVLGPVEVVGWMLVALTALALLGSLARAARSYVRRGTGSER